jgi:peptidoglycan/xylan/chitin deacetylase (PgdA/CDA1 family)
LAQALLDGLMQAMAQAGYTPRNRGVRSDRIKPEYLKFAHLYGYDARCSDCTRLLSLGKNPLLFRQGQWPVGALVEALFLSNPQDVAFLRRPEALTVIAQGLHRGVRAYFEVGQAVPSAAEEITQVPTTRRAIALTFDCGPWVAAPTLEAVLQALDQADVRATFFVTGQFIERHPGLFQRVAERHELANHSYSHTSFTTLSRAQQQEELRRTEELAQHYGYTTRPLWRAPHGARTPEVLRAAAEAGWPRHVFWSLRRTSAGWVSGDSGDWQEGATPQSVTSNVLRGLEQFGPGAVFVLHCGSGATAQALPGLLAAVRAQGYAVVPVSALLAGEGAARQ